VASLRPAEVLVYCETETLWITDDMVMCVYSEYPCAPPPSRCKSASSLVNDDLLVRIKLKLVDRNHPQFVSKYNSVSNVYFYKFFSINFLQYYDAVSWAPERPLKLSVQ